MSTSFAEMDDRVYLELEVVAEFCQIDKIHNAVVQRHNVRVAQSRTSSINVLLGVSAEFTPTTTEYNITSLIGKGVPVQIEYEASDNEWIPIRVVGLNQLSDYDQLGMLAAAFSATEANSDITEPVQYVTFSYAPNGPCRIRFDRDLVRTGLTEQTLLPDHTSELIIKEAQNTIIPRIKIAIDVRSRNDKELRAIARDLKASLSEIYAQNALEIKQLEPLWKIWAFRDRGTEDTFNKPTPSGRGLYGGTGHY